MTTAILRLIHLFTFLLFGLTAGTTTIILTSDQQLNDLLDPDKVIDLSTGYNKRHASLRQICENAQKNGDKILTIAFDEFFRQYREHAGTERRLTPDMDEYVDKIKVIADFAANYGMNMGLSLLSPLELGPAFKNQTGQTGRWLHYKVGLRDPQTGKFHVQLWQQHYWTNNKGKFAIRLKSFKAYAFKEKSVPDTPFKAVDRNDIVPLKEVALDQWDSPIDAGKEGGKLDAGTWSAPATNNESKVGAKRVSIYAEGSNEHTGFDRVLVLLEYEVPEMEYFSPQAYPFLQNLLQKYADKGIQIDHLYSDEMHIQQDWYYFDHHDNGQFALRYYTTAMGEVYREKFGVPFEEKDLLYFVYGPDINGQTVMAGQNIQYVMGSSVEDIQQTHLFRDRYYKLLNNHVVDLFKRAKSFASELFQVEDFGTHGHASWAESPTVDIWKNSGLEERHAYKYEYTPDFVWGNTVQQAAAACYDYFKWGEYLEPTRNDFGELGWNDRNYYGAAMATSIGVVNRIPNAYPAVWGMPAEVKERKVAINDAYGGRPRSTSIDLITGHIHRDVDVLMLYPMNLVAAEERFGSWMTQYGYANFITAEKLLELGRINDRGEIEVKDKKYTTLVALFEPLPPKGLLDLMEKLALAGGRALWFGQPPVLNGDGEKCLEKWQEIFGVRYTPTPLQGQTAAGRRIDFREHLENIPPQHILTDFVVDKIYPVQASQETSKLAFCDNHLLIGTGKGNAYYFGFRPRDDQSASLGYETRTLFEILDKVGAHQPTGAFPEVNDNTEHLSRTTDYLATRFPNGATVLVRHYRTHRENWPGGFSRDPEQDKMVLEKNPLPPADINLRNFKVNGHEISVEGRLTVAFRTNERKELIAFEGQECKSVTIDGKAYAFSDIPLKKIAFAPSLDNSQNEWKIYVEGQAQVNIPLPGEIPRQGIRFLDQEGKKIKYALKKNTLQFEVNPDLNGQWLNLYFK